jgi:molybdopterin molybdotransferase
MDGYAIRCADVAFGSARLRVTQLIPAGSMCQALEPGTAARIFTGAPIPAGADGLVEIPEGRTVARRDTVEYIAFSGLLS